MFTGDSAIDLGCGPRGVIDLLAERVAPGGRVVGFDANTRPKPMLHYETLGLSKMVMLAAALE